MSYVLLSRLIYAFPILIYAAINLDVFLGFPEALPKMAFWAVMFCFSLFFFCISKRILPLLLIHFVFFVEAYLFTEIAMDTGLYNILLFIILSSFYTIESLRNNILHMFFHVLSLFGILYYVSQLYGITLSDINFTNETLAILTSFLVCRALMSSLEERDVVLKEKIKTQEIFIPTNDTEAEDKLKRKLEFFKNRTKDLKKEAEEAKENNERLRTDYQRAKSQFEKMYEANQANIKINKDIAKSYFSLMANIRFDLSKSVTDNLDNILKAFMRITNSQYVALIVKEPLEDNPDEYNLALLNSYNGGIQITDESIISNEEVYDTILDSLEKDKSNFITVQDNSLSPLKNIILTPVSTPNDVKGVLVQAFDKNYVENIHNFNLSLMVAYHIYTVLKNENLYKQAKDESNIDALTHVFNKKYLLDNLQLIYNNAYNYASRLACVFVDVDYFKQVNDSMGHEMGDKVLQYIAKELQNHVRKSDFVFRYGGDEFVLLLNGATKEKIEGLSAQINQILKDKAISVPVNGERKLLSISIGAVIYNPDTANINSGEEMLSLADRAVYTAKNMGKGRLYVGTTE